MTQVFEPYWRWEDFHHGMYDTPHNLTTRIADARSALAHPSLIDHMRRVCDEWPNAAAHHMTNLDENRRAWLGQAACSIWMHVPAIATRAAWGQLTDAQRSTANRAAERVMAEWEEDHAQTLFGD